jgi:AcrR family transcriptional regulator
MDRRTVKTRAALLLAFRELVLTRGYSAVAIVDIIRHASIGRSTFYLHFSSKRNLLEHCLDGPCAGLAACVDGDFVPERLIPLLEHFRDQRHLNRVFFEDPIRSIWVGRLTRLIARKLRGNRVSSYRGQPLPRSFVAGTIAELQIAMVIHWLRNPSSVTPERFATAILSNTRALLPSSRRPPA